MKKIYFLLIALSFLSTAKAQIVNIPDAYFKAKLLAASTTIYTAQNLSGNWFKIDVNNDGQIQLTEALQVSYLNISYSTISDLTGILSFNNLQTLNCSGNLLPTINIIGLTNLKSLDCSKNSLSSLDVNGLTNLQYLYCNDNLLTSINVSTLANILYLFCSENSLTQLDVSNLINLSDLRCSNNQLTTLVLTGSINIKYLTCNSNQLSNLDLTGLKNITNLSYSNNQISNLSFDSLTELNYLLCDGNNISNLNLAPIKDLRGLVCSNNLLTTIDISPYSGLHWLDCRNNFITTLSFHVYDFERIYEDLDYYLDNNQLTSIFIKNGHPEVNFTFSNNPNLQYICVDDEDFSSVESLINSYGYTNCTVNTYCSYTQTFCDTSTVANLAPNGTDIKWYDSATGGTQLDSTTLLTTKTYYYTQTVNGIEGALISVEVKVNSLPSKPGIITGEVSPGALVGTTIPATYSIAAVSGASSYVWTVATGVNIVSGQGSTSIVVNFKDVPAGAGAIGNLMVQSINDSGCFSVAEKQALTISLPAAPDSLVMTDGVTSTPITSFAKYMGTTTILKLTAELVATATSYEWELPTGVNRTDAIGINSTVPYIYVNFSGVTKANTFTPVSTYVLRIGVKSKNGVGVSTTNNTTLVNPTTTSTAKLVTLNAVFPGAVSSVLGQVSGICDASSYIYTFTADALASSYVITAPAGSVVTSTINPTNSGNVLTTSDLTFTVTYPIGFSIKSKVVKTIAITSVNGIGNSLTNKVITLSTTMPAVGSIGGGTTYSSCNQIFTATQVVGATTYTWTVPSRASIVSGQGTNTVVVNYGKLTGAQTIKVKTTNSCGVSSAVTSLSLTAGTCPTAKQSNPVVFSVNKIIVYPNPVSSLLFIRSADNTAIDKVMVVDLSGRVILEEKPVNNQINVDQFASGTYIIEAFSGNEKFQSKFIKK